MNVLWIVVRGKQHDYHAMTLPPTHRYVYPKNVTVVKEAVEISKDANLEAQATSHEQKKKV